MHVTFYSHTLSVNQFSFLNMEFWNIANASIHQARQCLELDHTYPDEIDLHIARLQQILTPLTTFQQAHGAIAERDPNVIQWETGVNELLTTFLQLRAQSQPNESPSQAYASQPYTTPERGRPTERGRQRGRGGNSRRRPGRQREDQQLRQE